MAEQRYIIIVGSGRLGSLLANQLSKDGHKLVVIDRNEAAFNKLSVEFTGYKLVGDASEQSILRQANIEEADTVFATTSEDNINLMVAQIAKRIFNIECVIARIDDPSRERVFEAFGVETISPTQLTANAFLRSLHAKQESH